MKQMPRKAKSPEMPQTSDLVACDAVVIISGGLDSLTAAAWAKSRGHRLIALSINYGQRHSVELAAARRVAASLEIREHIILSVDLSQFGGSALTDPTIRVPKDRTAQAIGHGIPTTYVPARNTVLLSLALSMAEARGAGAIVLGVNAIDYSGYPDCRPEYIEAFSKMASLATRTAVEGGFIEILCPLQSLSKSEIIILGQSLGVDYGLTSSCYDPAADGSPCGICDACILRHVGFEQAGCVDPLITRSSR